ncbi:thiamine pyrophosphate-binding protein [Natrarchaeobius halalkaliphilus]|uniref:Thiamine pyrophosphate-binding protein n=1 Tax=Natrarchaeobius halalkaliphilus TaxID=1679091 RepID=A0A3N6P0A6_9EURY|nr:thiamine pyrophosphate-binding protein [Natrarchaeobius halalkaliphilus]RQG87858.1 thiamine pyrophosphate-binding protein [Natrarchaeobius halalkaliphilus]
MKAHEAIVEMFVNEDVDTIFSLTSEEIIPILSEAEDKWGNELRVVNCRHEQGAAAMADGYSRADDGIGVCIVGRGPAIAQTGTALQGANNHGSNVLYLVPETRLTATHDGKGFEQETFLRSMAGEVESVRSSDVLLSSLADVFRRIRAGDGPIAVQVPIDVLESNLSETSILEDYTTPGSGRQDARIHPDETKLEEALDAYLDSDATKAPIIIAGRGAMRSDAKEEIEQLAERMNAYLVTTLQANGYFSDHPYSLGFAGDLGTRIANKYLSETGFVFALGCSLNHHTVDKGHLLSEEANIVHVDIDPTHIGRYTDVNVGIVGDVRTTTEAFREELKSFGIDRSGEFWTDRVRRRIEDSSPMPDRSFEDQPGTVDPRDLIEALDDTLPDGRLVYSDVGHFCGWVFDGLTIDPTDRLTWLVDFLALGQGLPVGIGAALAEDDRTCVVFCGDGGLMMSLPELDTAVRHDVPMIVVVINDDALGAEYHMGKKRGYSGSVGKIRAPDFEALATDMGAEAHTVRSVDDVEAIEAELTPELSGPVIVDCRVNPEARHRTMGEMSID